MKVAVIGSGGREHALAWRFSLSPLASDVGVFPGNPGMGLMNSEGVPIRSFPIKMDASNDWSELKRALTSFGAGYVVVGPDNPLAEGIVDSLKNSGFKVFGPSKAAARLEASKSFGKKIARKAKIPTAASETFETYEGAKEYLSSQVEGSSGVVVKADGLALGKGVTVCDSKEQALKALEEILKDKRFGETKALVEERMEGQELSAFFICKDAKVQYVGSACDYKRAYDGDLGPNTGGMGTISPFPCKKFGIHEKELLTELEGFAVQTMEAMRSEESPFEGFLFLGLMLREDRDYLSKSLSERLHLIEYNVRMGDPECQSLMLRLDEDLLEALLSDPSGNRSENGASSQPVLASSPMKSKSEAVCTVVAASKGYPVKTETGFEISGCEKIKEAQDVKIFFAGVSGDRSKLYNSGGRVFSVSTLGESLSESQKKAYEWIEKCHFKGMWYRKDIGESLIKARGES